MRKLIRCSVAIGFVIALAGCSDGGGKIVPPKDTKPAPPPPLSPAGGKAPKQPANTPQ